MSELSEAVRERVVKHVLREIHPDRIKGEVVGTAPIDRDFLVGVKVHPRGFLSTASYALVTVDEDGRVVKSEACTGQEIRQALGADAR